MADGDQRRGIGGKFGGRPLVERGGLLLTCSGAGLLAESEFLRLIYSAARQARRTLQILAKTGAAADHPVAANCPETEYLKAAWLRVT